MQFNRQANIGRKDVELLSRVFVRTMPRQKDACSRMMTSRKFRGEWMLEMMYRNEMRWRTIDSSRRTERADQPQGFQIRTSG